MTSLSRESETTVHVAEPLAYTHNEGGGEHATWLRRPHLRVGDPVGQLKVRWGKVP